MPDPTPPTSPPPAPSLQLTPGGTPVIPPQIAHDPQLVAFFTAALNTMPPGAVPVLLNRYKGYVLALIIPLLLTTWTNLKEIWDGPATVSAIKKRYEDDAARVEALEKKVEANTAKLEQVLRILESKDKP